jgi:putative sterol carrier protein
MATLQQLTDRVTDLASRYGKEMGATIKITATEGSVFIDARQFPLVVSNEDKEADCVITADTDTAYDLLHGKVNIMSAFMFGKVKVKGDMGIATKMMGMIVKK